MEHGRGGAEGPGTPAGSTFSVVRQGLAAGGLPKKYKPPAGVPGPSVSSRRELRRSVARWLGGFGRSGWRGRRGGCWCRFGRGGGRWRRLRSWGGGAGGRLLVVAVVRARADYGVRGVRGVWVWRLCSAIPNKGATPTRFDPSRRPSAAATAAEDPRQPHVRTQRRRLGRLQQPRQHLQGDEHAHANPADLRQPPPPDPHPAHVTSSPNPPSLLPPTRPTSSPASALNPSYATPSRSSAISRSCSSTQSPGLREKMISFSRSARTRRSSGSIVRAR